MLLARTIRLPEARPSSSSSLTTAGGGNARGHGERGRDAGVEGGGRAAINDRGRNVSAGPAIIKRGNAFCFNIESNLDRRPGSGPLVNSGDNTPAIRRRESSSVCNSCTHHRSQLTYKSPFRKTFEYCTRNERALQSLLTLARCQRTKLNSKISALLSRRLYNESPRDS